MSNRPCVFYAIECRCEKDGSPGKYVHWLGDIETSRPNITHHHCKYCNTTYEHEVTDEMQIVRRVIKGRIVYADQIARLE